MAATFLTRPSWRTALQCATPGNARTAYPCSLNKFRFNHTAPPPKKTVVEQYLLDRIKLAGPLPFATYMQQCLSHPTHGYYMNPENSVFGTRGDFITSPEISQIFGELLAVWMISQYQISGKRSPLRFIELGPGKGTLMADILRVALQFLPGKVVNIHLVETSSAMRSNQKERLNFDGHPHVNVHWHNSISELSPSSSEYTMLVAHEFFDALPIHILQKSESGQWNEVLVALNAQEETSKDESSELTPEKNTTASPTESFRYVLAPQPSPISTVLGHSSLRFNELPAGSMLEVSPAAFKTAHQVGELLATGKPDEETPSLGGCGLIIDYGANHAFGNSLRAFRSHKIVDVFHQPGNSDLTANVDFAYLKEAMGGLVTTLGPIPQGAFLNGMGLSLRLQGLLKSAKTESRQEELRGAAARLVDPLGMGKEYQVLGITGEKSSPERTAATSVWPFVEAKP